MHEHFDIHLVKNLKKRFKNKIQEFGINMDLLKDKINIDQEKKIVTRISSINFEVL